MNRFLHLGSSGICKALALCEGKMSVGTGEREEGGEGPAFSLNLVPRFPKFPRSWFKCSI